MNNTMHIGITVDIGGVKYQYGVIMNKSDMASISETREVLEEERDLIIGDFASIAVLDSMKLFEKQISDTMIVHAN